MKALYQYVTYLFLAFALAVPMAGCETLNSMGASVSNFVMPKSPEAMIEAGANANVATTTLAATLLRNKKISSAQAEAYREIVIGANKSMNTMNDTLVSCRKSTGSTAATSPDPCKPAVSDLIALALKTIADVKLALDATK